MLAYVWKIVCWNRYAVPGVLLPYLIMWWRIFKTYAGTAVLILLDFQVKTAGYEKWAKSWMPKRITKVPFAFFLLANKEALKKILFPLQIVGESRRVSPFSTNLLFWRNYWHQIGSRMSHLWNKNFCSVHLSIHLFAFLSVFRRGK